MATQYRADFPAARGFQTLPPPPSFTDCHFYLHRQLFFHLFFSSWEKLWLYIWYFLGSASKRIGSISPVWFSCCFLQTVELILPPLGFPWVVRSAERGSFKRCGKTNLIMRRVVFFWNDEKMGWFRQGGISFSSHFCVWTKDVYRRDTRTHAGQEEAAGDARKYSGFGTRMWPTKWAMSGLNAPFCVLTVFSPLQASLLGLYQRNILVVWVWCEFQPTFCLFSNRSLQTCCFTFTPISSKHSPSGDTFFLGQDWNT